MVNRHKIQSKSFLFFKFMDVQCEYINLILNYNNIHTTYFTVSGYYDFNFDGRRKTTDVNIKVRFRYSLFWIKPKHCK